MSSKRPSLATAIAPEDIRRGDSVAILNEIHQFLLCFDAIRRVEQVSVRLLPDDAPQPLEVIDVCLPFVTVKQPCGEVVTLDVRRHELARLDEDYARRVTRRMRSNRRDGTWGC